MKATAQQPSLAEPKRGPPKLAPAKGQRTHDAEPDEAHDARRYTGLLDRAMPPAKTRTATTGYGDLIAAAQAPSGLDVAGRPAPLQAKAASDPGSMAALSSTPGANAALSPDATGMPAPVRAKMEGAFGADFSDVRVHPGAARATELGALAFTQGSEIHVAPGQWSPETTKGQELLGHELAHVLQQRAGRVTATAQFKGVGLNDEPALEAEADAMGARAARVDAVKQPTPFAQGHSGEVSKGAGVEGPRLDFLHPGFAPSELQFGALSDVSVSRAFARDPVRSVIQTNLTASRFDDMYEQEADQAVNKIMRMPGPFREDTVKGECRPKLPARVTIGKSPPPVQRQPEKTKGQGDGESIFPDIFNLGVGTVENKTTRTFSGNASHGKNGELQPVLIGPGAWGGARPLIGPTGEKLDDIDFVFPTKEKPVNGMVDGAYKIGSNDATVEPDSNDAASSKIDDWSAYLPHEKAEELPGYPAQKRQLE